MHNIKTNFDHFMKICKEYFKNDVDRHGNFKFYPKLPKMSDLEIIGLSVTMEALSIDSENLFFKKIETDYSKKFPNLIDRSRFNRRRKQLKERIGEYKILCVTGKIAIQELPENFV
jgi:hypothetical protein